MQAEEAHLLAVDDLEGEDGLGAVGELAGEVRVLGVHARLHVHFFVRAVQHADDDVAAALVARLLRRQEVVDARLDVPRQVALGQLCNIRR